jgi:coenzyme F420 hydrogenase subunit beta
MTFAALQSLILDQDLCMGCGACQLACPGDAIRFDGLIPTLSPDWSLDACGQCEDCTLTCPGADPCTPLIEAKIFGRTRSQEERWIGITKEILFGRALDPDIYDRSSSGGSTTALLQASAQLMHADYVLAMGQSQRAPWHASPVIAGDPSALNATVQSKYQIVPYLGVLRPLLAAEQPYRIVVVGLPCHIQGIRKLQSIDSNLGARARDRLIFLVEIACSSGTPPAGTASFITEVARLSADDVTMFQYRGGKYPGGVIIGTRAGEELQFPFWRMVEHLTQHKAHRCLSCPDWLSGVADIAVSDGDSNILASSRDGKHPEKCGRIYVRTAKAEDVVNYAVDHSILSVWAGDLSAFNLGLERKRNRRTRFEQEESVIPAGPMPDYFENIEPKSDEEILGTRGNLD